MSALDDIAQEFLRQRSEEGWSADHDDTHYNGQIARAAGAYAIVASGPFAPGEYRSDPTWTWPSDITKMTAEDLWPWSSTWWKPRGHRENLVRAGALIAAEIERLDRLEKPKT